MPTCTSNERTMPTRNVVLTKHQANLVKRLVSSGRYQNASEVLREGLRLVENRDAEEKIRRDALRQAARAGIADFEAGRFRTFESDEALGQHLAALADDAIASTATGTRRK
jgi:antitoxin ParD1/3/4